MTTGQLIKAARKKAGLTQEDLGKKLGVSGSFIAQYETNKRNPKRETLQRIAAALGTTVSNLLPPDNYWEDENGVGHTEPQVPTIEVHDEPIQAPKVVVHDDPPDELEALLAKLQDGEPLVLSPEELAKLKGTPKEQIAAALDKAADRERDITIAELRAQMEKMRQRYGPSAFPEFDELGPLLYKLQSDTITQDEQTRIKTLLDSVQKRLKTYCEMAPSPQSTLSPQDKELRERWNKLSLSEIFVVPGNHDIGPTSLGKLHGTVKLLKAPVFKMDAIVPPGRKTRYEHSLGTIGIAQALMNQLNGPRARIAAALDQLNEEGQEKAAERVEELAEIPRYQVQDAPQDTPPAPKGTDTTQAETPPKGRITSITMLCPICGQSLHGDTATGKAYCAFCKRSFQLPEKAKSPRS